MVGSAGSGLPCEALHEAPEIGGVGLYDLRGEYVDYPDLRFDFGN